MATKSLQRKTVPVVDHIIEIKTSIAAMAATQAAVEQKVDGINDRLDRLNGKVAKHEERFGLMEQAAAASRAADAAAQSTNSKWVEWVKYPILFALGIVFTLVLLHGKDLLAVKQG